MNTRLLYSLLLAFALLFAQQGAALHALAHLAENPAPQQEKHLPHSPVCDKCVVYAGIGGAAVSAPQPNIAFQAAVLAAVLLPVAFFSVLCRAYRSRAPPRHK